jgi:ribosomal protein L32
MNAIFSYGVSSCASIQKWTAYSILNFSDLDSSALSAPSAVCSLQQGSHSGSGTSYIISIHPSITEYSQIPFATWRSLWTVRNRLKKRRRKTHFFLTAKGIGQMIAEKSDSSDMRRAKHTICQLCATYRIRKLRTYESSKAVYHKEGSDQFLTSPLNVSCAYSHFCCYC